MVTIMHIALQGVDARRPNSGNHLDGSQGCGFPVEIATFRFETSSFFPTVDGKGISYVWPAICTVHSAGKTCEHAAGINRKTGDRHEIHKNL